MNADIACTYVTIVSSTIPTFGNQILGQANHMKRPPEIFQICIPGQSLFLRRLALLGIIGPWGRQPIREPARFPGRPEHIQSVHSHHYSNFYYNLGTYIQTAYSLIVWFSIVFMFR